MKDGKTEVSSSSAHQANNERVASSKSVLCTYLPLPRLFLILYTCKPMGPSINYVTLEGRKGSKKV